MKNRHIPRTPFSTRLSGSAKTTERRIRNIFQGPKKRPPIVLMVLTAAAILSCGWLVSCEPRNQSQNQPQMPEIVMDLQYYDTEHSNYIEVPTLVMPDGAEPTEDIAAINQALAELSAEYQPLSDLPFETQCLFYPSATSRYLNLVFFRDTFYTDLNTGHVLSLVYDAETGQQVTLEDALTLAGTSEAEIFAALSAQIDAELDVISQANDWGKGALRVQNPALEGFRIRTDGSAAFYLTARTDDADNAVADLISGADNLYIYQDGVFSRYDQYNLDPPALIPAEETLLLDPPLWCQRSFAVPVPVISADSFRAVLLGEAPLLYMDEDGAVQSIDITQVPAIFSPYSSYAGIDQFVAIDLDGDGAQEIVLHIGDVANDMGGYLILHQENGEIYGFTSHWRTFWNLKTDGTFAYDYYMTGSGIASIRFTETGYVMDTIIGSQTTYYDYLSPFTVDGQPASEEEYLAALNRQEEKPDAVWYDFTPENIDLVLPLEVENGPISAFPTAASTEVPSMPEAAYEGLVSWTDDAVYYWSGQTRSGLLADYGFQDSAPFYTYYDGDNLQLEMYYDAQSGICCGFRRDWNEPDAPPSIYGFVCPVLDESEGMGIDVWGNTGPYSVRPVYDFNSDDVQDYLESTVYNDSGKLEKFVASYVPDYSDTRAGLYSFEFDYREDGSLRSKHYFHNSMYFGTTYGTSDLLYDEAERLIFTHSYITHGHLESYYIYENGNVMPSYCLSLDCDLGSSYYGNLIVYTENTGAAL